MRQMKDSKIDWVGCIPEEWNLHPVKYAFSEIRTKNTDGVVSNALKFFNGTIIPKSNFDAETDEYVAETITNYTIVDPDTIMINGLNLNYDLKSLRVGLVKEKGIITSAYLALKPDKLKISPRYATYLFKGYESKMAFHNMGEGIRKTLGFKEFKKQPVLFPNMNEQIKIADFLDCQCAHIETIIERTKTSIEEYRKLRQTVITQAITKGIRGDRTMKQSNIAWIGEIPEEWDIAKIKIGVSKVGSGKTPLGGAEIYSKEGVLFLRSQNIYDTGLNLDDPTYISQEIDDEMKNTRVYPNDVLLNITGGSIGRCCIFPTTLKCANVNQHVSIIRVIETVFTPEYMKYYWNSSIGKLSIALYQTGGNREGMSAEAIKNSPIMVLPILEQKEITSYLDKKCAEIDTLITKKELFLTELENYKKSMVFEYATGKKEVPSA